MGLGHQAADSEQLTQREVEILHWSAVGKTAVEQGIILDISPNTVSFHLKNVYRKLDVGNRINAVSRALELGIIFNDREGRKARIQDAYRGFVEGNPMPLMELLSPEIEWIATAPQDMFPHAGSSIGIEAAQSRIMMLAGQYKSRRFLPRIFVEEADRIAVYLDVELIHLESGTPMAFDVAHFWTFQGDKVVRYLELFNSGLAERQLNDSSGLARDGSA